MNSDKGKGHGKGKGSPPTLSQSPGKGVEVEGKGKGKSPPPPPASQGKGKGKGPALTLETPSLSRPRMAQLMSDGSTIQGMTMSGELLFSFAADGIVTVRALTKEIQNAVRGDAANARVALLMCGSPMQYDDLISDLSLITVKWSKGWKKVMCEEQILRPEVAIGLPVDEAAKNFQDCRSDVLRHLREKWEKRIIPGRMTGKPEIVEGFKVKKGTPGASWPTVSPAIDLFQQNASAEALPIETDIPDFDELRQSLIRFEQSKVGDDHFQIRVIPAAGSQSDLVIPPQRSVDLSETVRTHLQQPLGVVETFPVAAFGFRVAIDLHGKDLCTLLELIKAGDGEGVAQHATAGKDFEIEAARLGIHLSDALPCLQVKTTLGGFECSLHPKQDIFPREIVGVVPLTFSVGIHALPREAPREIPSAADLCAVALNPASSNELIRLALEALTAKSVAQDSELSSEAKQGLVTIGCELAIHSDAGVREQAQELLGALKTEKNLHLVRAFFTRHRHSLGPRIVQELGASGA